MSTSLLWFVMVAGLIAAAAGQCRGWELPDDYPYRPAFISTAHARPGHTELVVFPISGEAFAIPVSSASGPFAYGPDGKSLYGQCTPYSSNSDEPVTVALCKIDLTTGRTAVVPGSRGVHINSLAVSKHEDLVVLSGMQRLDNKAVYGLFEISIPSGNVRPIFLEASGDIRTQWNKIALSPDGERAVAIRSSALELIDLVHGTAKRLEDGLFMGAWSPDGKWLAVLEKGERGRTILIDAKTLSHVRTLGPSELDWSPDSHYLLGLKSCNEYYGTLEAIDIQNDMRTAITSSTCKINQATTGWVRRELGQR